VHKVGKIFAYIISFLSILLCSPSYAKSIWLKCDSKPGDDPRLLFLDSTKERFEITELNQTIQGKATFFESFIKFEYLLKLDPISIRSIMEIDRATLNYSGSRQILPTKSPHLLLPPTPTSGSCKVIPAPPSKKNQI